MRAFGPGDGGGFWRSEVFSNLCQLHLLLWHTLINPQGGADHNHLLGQLHVIHIDLYFNEYMFVLCMNLF